MGLATALDPYYACHPFDSTLYICRNCFLYVYMMHKHVYKHYTGVTHCTNDPRHKHKS